MTTTQTESISLSQIARHVENYAEVTECDGELKISCSSDLCEDVQSVCEGTGWAVEWSGTGNTDGRDGVTYEDGTVKRASATYRIFTREATSFETFSSAPQTTVETGLTKEEAREACRLFNQGRSEEDVARGLKMEFTKEED